MNRLFFIILTIFIVFCFCVPVYSASGGGATIAIPPYSSTPKPGFLLLLNDSGKFPSAAIPSSTTIILSSDPETGEILQYNAAGEWDPTSELTLDVVFDDAASATSGDAGFNGTYFEMGNGTIIFYYLAAQQIDTEAEFESELFSVLTPDDSLNASKLSGDISISSISEEIPIGDNSSSYYLSWDLGTLTGNHTVYWPDADVNMTAFDPDWLAGDSNDDDLVDHEIGGLEVDISSYDGLIRINGGSTTNVTDAAGLETALSLGAYASDLLGTTSEANFKSTTNLEIGVDVLAEQTIGIGNDNLVEMDDADAADDDYAKLTANGLEGRSTSEVRSDIAGISDTPSNGTVDAVTTMEGTAGEALSWGDVCFNDNDNGVSEWFKFQATNATDAHNFARAMVVESGGISDGSAGTFLLQGTVRNDSWGMASNSTEGSQVYASNATAGSLMTTIPGASEDIVQILGFVLEENVIYFNPDYTTTVVP